MVGKDESDIVVRVEELSKTFGSGEESVQAVEDVSFVVREGEVVGLLGPNGAGKTTIIKSILGLVEPDSGSVEINGINAINDRRAACEHVDAMLEGARNDYWRLTVRENLRYFAAIRGEDPDALTERHDALLGQLDIAEKADTPVRELSRGMKQKVSLASVLASGASVAFLDEPTLGLDVESALTLRQELVRLADQRALSLVITSHDMDVIENVCDRVIIINDGKIAVDDAVDDLLEGFDINRFQITVQDLDENGVARLQERFDLKTVERVDETVEFTVDTSSEQFYRLASEMEQLDATIDSIQTIEPDLAEVFLNVTGNDDVTALKQGVS